VRSVNYDSKDKPLPPNPAVATYLGEGEVMDVPVDRCRGFGMKPAQISHPDHPFIQMLQYMMETPEVDLVNNPLADYYKRVAPKSAAEVVGLTSSHALGSHHSLGAVMPWFGVGPDKMFEYMKRGMLAYYDQQDMPDWTIDDGHTQYGPVSQRKLELEIKRLHELLESIQLSKGFDRSNHYPLLGNVLANDITRDWVCDIKDGLHRVAVLTVLGDRSVPVRIIQTIDKSRISRSKSAEWPLVEAGWFTEKDALKIFDSYMEGTL